jgi:hypothetical protein
MRKFVIVLVGAVMLAGIDSSVVQAQNIKTEAVNHPRIASAIRELEGAVAYLEAAPHDFGGHKAAALKDSRAALVSLRAALAFRAKADR